MGAWLRPKPQGVFGLWLWRPGTGVAELSMSGLVHSWCLHSGPCGHKAGSGAAWPADVGGIRAERETLPHPHPVCQNAYCDWGVRWGFLPVVPSLPSCKTSPHTAPPPAILEPSPQSRSFSTATSVSCSLSPAESPNPMVFPAQALLPC